jgi:integrase
MSQGGHIVKPKGTRKTWSIMYRDPDGKMLWEGKFEKKSAAQTRLTEVLGEINKGTFARPNSVTFEKFSESWLAGRRQIRGSTESAYGSLLKRQLLPRLGSLRVAEIRLKHIETAVSGMIEDELSSKTIHNAVTLLRTMLAGKKKGASAVLRGLRFTDPTLGLELPTLRGSGGQIVPPTPEQVWALINAAKEIGGIGYAITYVGAFTGVRRNEALGLQFSDIEWFEHEVRVKHAVSKRRGRDGVYKWEWHLGPPKSRKSNRNIAVTESVMHLLADLKGRAKSEFLFPGNTGAFIDPDKLDAEIWKPVATRAGLPGTRFHDLRHFFASQLIACGETAAFVRDQMGHSSIQVTFDTYGHLFPGRGKEASGRYEKAMEEARGKTEAAVSNLSAIAASASENVS